MQTISQMLADAASPRWAQAILGAVAISGAIAVIAPLAGRMRERKRAAAARLTITWTAREDVLELYVSFTPEERNAGVVAKISVLAPANIVLFEQLNEGIYDPRSSLARTIQCKLLRDSQSEGDEITCLVMMAHNNGEGWDRKARIKVQAWTDVSPRLLSERTFDVSAFRY